MDNLREQIENIVVDIANYDGKDLSKYVDALLALFEKREDEIRIETARLNWIKILDEAINARPTSWGKDVVREWRNASDEVWGAFMRHCYKKGIFKDPLREDSHE